MKTFIIAALTADGFIAKDADHKADWTSRADKKFFHDMTKKAGVVIMGSKTYETVGMPLKERRNIIYTKHKKFEGVEVTSESPEILLARLEKENVREVAICGGASIYSLFLEKNLVDKLYLTIEQIIFGQGITLFDKALETRLELVDAIKLEGGAVVLEYNVIR